MTNGKAIKLLYLMKEPGMKEPNEAIDLAIRALAGSGTVRCRDCKHWSEKGHGYREPWECSHWCAETEPDDYCSFGEKKR